MKIYFVKMMLRLIDLPKKVLFSGLVICSVTLQVQAAENSTDKTFKTISLVSLESVGVDAGIKAFEAIKGMNTAMNSINAGVNKVEEENNIKQVASNSG